MNCQQDDSAESADGFGKPSYQSPPHYSPNASLYTTDRNQGVVLALENGGWPNFLKNCDEIATWTKRNHGSHSAADGRNQILNRRSPRKQSHNRRSLRSLRSLCSKSLSKKHVFAHVYYGFHDVGRRCAQDGGSSPRRRCVGRSRSIRRIESELIREPPAERGTVPFCSATILSDGARTKGDSPRRFSTYRSANEGDLRPNAPSTVILFTPSAAGSKSFPRFLYLREGGIDLALARLALQEETTWQI